MATTLTRTALYELIGSQPRTALAKDLGVSDVAIGKHYARTHIPGPPPGCWARRRFGKFVARPPLPLRLPGHPAEVKLGPPDRSILWSESQDLELPLVAPAFPEEMEKQVAEAMRKIGRVRSRRDLSEPHQGLRHVLAAEDLRRERYARDGWKSHKPLFDDPIHQRQPRLFNSLAHALAPVTERLDVFPRYEVVQGWGTVSLLRCRLAVGDATLELEFVEPGEGRERPPKAVRATTLRTGWASSELGVQDWMDEPASKEAIVEGLLFRAERALKANADWVFVGEGRGEGCAQKEGCAKRAASQQSRLLPVRPGVFNTRGWGMADSTVRFTFSWGDMKLELEGDAAPTLAELQNIRANRLGHLADFFGLRTGVGAVIHGSPGPVPAPPRIELAPVPPTGMQPATRFAITRLRLPTNNAEAAAMARRHGSDGSGSSNLFGSVLAGMAQSLSLDLGAVVATPAPSSIWLLDFEPDDGATPAGARITIRGGRQRSGAAGDFVVDGSVGAQILEGEVVNHTFVSVPHAREGDVGRSSLPWPALSSWD